jgi:predicted metalloprotease
MRWQGRRKSSNVEDQRGSGGGRMMGGLGGGLLTKGGIGMVLVILVIGWLTGTNPLSLLQQMGGSSGVGYDEASVEQPYTPSAEEQELADFTSVVLAYTEDVWNNLVNG